MRLLSGLNLGEYGFRLGFVVTSVLDLSLISASIASSTCPKTLFSIPLSMSANFCFKMLLIMSCSCVSSSAFEPHIAEATANTAHALESRILQTSPKISRLLSDHPAHQPPYPLLSRSARRLHSSRCGSACSSCEARRLFSGSGGELLSEDRVPRKKKKNSNVACSAIRRCFLRAIPVPRETRATVCVRRGFANGGKASLAPTCREWRRILPPSWKGKPRRHRATTTHR
mmetsp:Transcript_16698/g.30654  ORF Transcript_16698/g.30654 Transcript_16698/m.30654 type:complete len:229 (-) Transcript_16698:684-1370(-)